MDTIVDVAIGVFIGHFGWNMLVALYNKVTGKNVTPTTTGVVR